MSTSHPSNEERLSQQFDQESPLPPHVSESDASLTHAWMVLGEALRDIPVEPCDLTDSVRVQLVNRAHPVVDTSASRRRRSLTATLTSVIALACCLAVLLFVPVIPVSELGPLASISPDVLAEELSECDVVLVRLPDGDGSAEDFLSESLGVAPTPRAETASPVRSSEVEGQEVYDGLMDFDLVHNPDLIDDMTREELLDRLVESVATPSLAEEHFGDLLVVLPRDLIDEIRSGNAANVSLADLEADDSKALENGDAVDQPRRLIFVVMKSPEMKDVGTPDDSGARLLPGPNVRKRPNEYTGV